MTHNKFLDILKTLSKQEIDAFYKHLKLNHSREKIGLGVLTQIIGFYPDFEQIKAQNIAHIYQKVFNAPFDEKGRALKNFQNTCFDLHKWLKNFLIAAKVQENKTLQQGIWLSILQERNLEKAFSKQAKTFYHHTRSTPFSTHSDAFPNWVASYFLREQLSRNKPLVHANIIQQCTETMTECWDIIRLKMACEMTLLHQTTQHLPAQKVLEAPTFQQLGLFILKKIYETLWRLTDTEEDVYFVQLNALLNEHGHRLDGHELQWILRYAFNFIAKKSRKNQDELDYKKMHRLNQIGLKYGVFSRDGFLPSSAFGNIVNIACLSKDVAWAIQFMNTNNHIIHPESRAKALLLAQAIIAFETGKFREVIQPLETKSFPDTLDNLRAKSLLLRSYFELKYEQDFLLDNCAFFENLLRRSPKTESVKAMLVFVLTLKLIVTQKSSKSVILKRIQNTPNMYSRKWLLQKTTDYEARYAARGITTTQHTSTFK